MAYHERVAHVSRSPLYHHPQQQQDLPRRTFNNRCNRFIPSRLSPSQTFRVECKAEERHFLGNTSPFTVNSPLRPLRLAMNDSIQPVQFRSEIIVHNNPETDVHIKSLRVAFHYHDDSPANAMSAQRLSPSSSSSIPSQSFELPKTSSQKPRRPPPPPPPPPRSPPGTRPIRNLQTAIASIAPAPSQTALHQWIDDICANEELMANDDIVFFIKNGEFFARIWTLYYARCLFLFFMRICEETSDNKNLT